MIRKLAPVGLCAGALFLSRPAGAFLVVSADPAQAPGPETRVLVLREEGRSVVVVAPSVRGQAKSFALVVPVQTSAATSLRTAPITLLERTEKLTGPRMDELWELDPCELHPENQAPPAATASAAASGSASASAAASGSAAAGAADAPIVDGNYAISTMPEAALKDPGKWLLDRGFKIAPEVGVALTRSLKPGMTLALAQIDGARLTFDKDVARLPPLAFVVNGAVSLPLGLAATGSKGPHDVVLDVLSPAARAEAANMLNLAVPTNLDTTEDVKGNLDGLYRAVLDYSFEKTPGAAITEYAWLAASCDGCAPGSGVTAEDLLAMGADRLPSAQDGTQREVIVDVPESLSRAPEGPPELKRALLACYDKTLGELRGLTGDVTVIVKTGEGGKVTEATIKDAAAEALGKCVADAARAVKLDKPNASDAIKASFALVSRAYLGGMVLSRLRVRTTSGSGAELELRSAAAIEGGREEGPTGEADKKVYFAEHANNFHARYVVRHPWAGPIACEAPKRDVWGPRPKNLPPSSGRPAASAAPSHSASARPTASTSASASGKPAAPSASERALAELLVGGELPDLSAFAIPFRAAEPAKPAASTAPVAAPSGTTSAAASAAATGTGKAGGDGGCGCRVPPGRGASEGRERWLAISAITALLLGIRRRKR